MADEIIIKYTADVSGLKADLKTVQTELKTTETVGTESANKTTASFNKTAESTKSLKAQLSELNKQLQKAISLVELGIEVLYKREPKGTKRMRVRKIEILIAGRGEMSQKKLRKKGQKQTSEEFEKKKKGRETT